MKKQNSKKQKNPEPLPPASKEMLGFYKNVFGTQSQEMTLYLMGQLSSVLRVSENQDSTALTKLTMDMQKAICPKDEVEAMLGVQMSAVHGFAMRILGWANNPEQSINVVEMSVELSNKLFRTFSAQMEALNRYRGKGHQKVTVEHVTVNKGGQAVIGSVERSGGGGGVG